MKTTIIAKRLNIKSLRASVIALTIALLPLLNMTSVNAAPILARSITLSSSVGAATGVTYTLNADALPTTGTNIQSAEIKFCTTASGACITPTGFTSSSSTLASQPTGLGAAAGWTVNTATSGSLRIVNSGNVTSPSGAVAIEWDDVTNPTANNSTFFGVISTYSDSSWTTVIDSGLVALSTSSQIQVALAVNETLVFCTGTSITGENCGTISGSLVNLGDGSTSSTATGTSVMAASTNGNTGYTITVNGDTLTSGSNTITALTAGSTSTMNTKQFGINLASTNTTPAVGSVMTGTGTATASANYGTNDTFRFATGDSVASATGPTNANAFTVSYIANIDGLTPAGAYTTNLTYIATANY